MAAHFKSKSPEQKRSVRYEIMLSVMEAEEIRTSARTRNLSVADFMRRAALGRRADVRYETETVLALREVVQAIRNLHATYVENKFQVPAKELGALIDEALAAMLRISK